MEKRYQVFVSSTYKDLVEERQEVTQALLEINCIPSGMELFPASDESQWELIQRVIDDCDYFLVVVAGRYGSIGTRGKSYTQLEYEYAVKQGKPVIAFFHGDPGKIVTENTEEKDEGKAKLAKFLELIKRKMCKPYTSPKELRAEVIVSVQNLIRTRPATGWVRADSVADESAAQEILRLRNHNESLEAEVDQLRNTGPIGTDDLAQGDDTFTLHYIYDEWSADLERGTREGELEMSWNEMFTFLAPFLIEDTAVDELSGKLNQWLYKRLNEAGIEQGLVPSASRSDLNTVIIQLSALGLITRSTRPVGVGDFHVYWTLTPYGEREMSRLKAIKKGS